MSILFSRQNDELIVTCNCGCEEACHIKIEKEEYNDDYDYSFISYMNGKFYNDPNSVWTTIKRKCSKIWSIIKNKDYYYSDIIMNQEDFKQFKEYINNF